MGFVTRRSAIRRGSKGTRGGRPTTGANLRKSSRGYKGAESNIYTAIKEGSPYSSRGVNLSAYGVSKLPDLLSDAGLSLRDFEIGSKYNSNFVDRLDQILEAETVILAAYGALVGPKRFQSGGLKLNKVEQPAITEFSNFRNAYEALKQRLGSQNNA